MKGVIIAGGKGTRLLPLTKLVNKSLLPIYNRALVEYPINLLLKAGIREILIITGPEHAGDFIEYFGSGNNIKADFTYRVQQEPLGIANALAQAESFVGGEPFTAILSDNIFDGNFTNKLKNFRSGARIFLKRVDDPRYFGVAVLEGKRVVKILEKPADPPTNYAVTGLYQYDAEVFKIIRKLKPSARGEFEITDVNNAYIKKGEMKAEFINGFWSDAGTFDSLVSAGQWALKVNHKKKS